MEFGSSVMSDGFTIVSFVNIVLETNRRRSDLREAELLADLEQMCARDRAKMETQVEAFQVCV